MAEVEAESGEWGKAAALYAEVFEIRDGEPWHLLAYSKALWSLGRIDDARVMWKRIVEGPPSIDEADRVSREQATENLRRFSGR